MVTLESILSLVDVKTMHCSVLCKELLEIFEGKSIRVLWDGTLGAGGHTAALLQAHPEIEWAVGVDRDPSALDIASERLLPWRDKVRLLRGNFHDLSRQVEQLAPPSIDALLLDLGVSSMQIDRADRGFSWQREGPLDMRMDPSQSLTAATIVNEWSEESLGEIFRSFGEEPQWRFAASLIVKKRKECHLRTTRELTELLAPMQHYHRRQIHYATLIFQALRLAVNGELEALESVLPQALRVVSPLGRLVVISFHSLEDRIVKQFFRHAASDKLFTEGIAGLFLDKQPEVELLTRKAKKPSEEEIRENPRARSARLRAVQKLAS